MFLIERHCWFICESHSQSIFVGGRLFKRSAQDKFQMPDGDIYRVSAILYCRYRDVKNHRDDSSKYYNALKNVKVYQTTLRYGIIKNK